ncbi:MAG: flagellar motor protein MotB, partial [bacterium]
MKDKRTKTEEDEDDTPSAPAWMMTYGDMMTLLMIFFILIMSFSTLELDKFKMAMGSLKGALGAFGIQKHLQPTQSFFSPYQINIQKLKANKMLDHIGDLKDLIKKNNLDEYVEIYVLDDSEVYIQIKDHVLFELGKAELKTKYLKILSLIGKT